MKDLGYSAPLYCQQPLYMIWVEYLLKFNRSDFGASPAPSFPYQDTNYNAQKHHKNFRFCK